MILFSRKIMKSDKCHNYYKYKKKKKNGERKKPKKNRSFSLRMRNICTYYTLVTIG